jgi:lysyl-tRNA synthetase class 2
MTPGDPGWQPNATTEVLLERARCLAWLRDFFRQHGVLEIETPLVSRFSVTDPHIDALAVVCAEADNHRYLQTSPEYAMKRLLAAGSGSIYQICKAFRAGESGGRHNPEFSMLEWYRVGFDHNALMAEVEALVCGYLGRSAAVHITYRELFQNHLGVDPLLASDDVLRTLARERVDTSFDAADRDTWLDLLLTELIEPKLAELGLVFIYDYPVTQAALARLGETSDGVQVAHRFELYVDGLELANGYHELCDPIEQRRRFARDNQVRVGLGKPAREADPSLLAALDAGMPDCAGVALGIDRLLMLKLGVESVHDVLTFDWMKS